MAKAKASEAIPALPRPAHQLPGASATTATIRCKLHYHRAFAAQAAYGDAAITGARLRACSATTSKVPGDRRP